MPYSLTDRQTLKNSATQLHKKVYEWSSRNANKNFSYFDVGKLFVLKSTMSPGNPARALYFVGVQLTQLASLEMKHSEDLLDILRN